MTLDGELTVVEKLPKEPFDFFCATKDLHPRGIRKSSRKCMDAENKHLLFKVSMGYEILHFLPRNICGILVITNASLKPVREA